MSTLAEGRPAEKDCTSCAYYDVVLGVKAVCMLWLVGFDIRGYELCDEYRAR